MKLTTIIYVIRMHILRLQLCLNSKHKKKIGSCLRCETNHSPIGLQIYGQFGKSNIFLNYPDFF
jgi:hypothetical protein